jgi:hypothetical protein
MRRRGRQPRCENCGAVIVAVLSDVGDTNGFLCLRCSGATLADFDDDDIDRLMIEDLDAKSDRLWELGAREQLGDKEFERLYTD